MFAAGLKVVSQGVLLNLIIKQTSDVNEVKAATLSRSAACVQSS